MSGLALEDVQAAQKLLKSFDPPGIGAQDLKDCLFFQLEAKGRGGCIAARIVRDHFELLTRRRIPDLARRLGVSLDEIQIAIEEIGTWTPRPADALRTTTTAWSFRTSPWRKTTASGAFSSTTTTFPASASARPTGNSSPKVSCPKRNGIICANGCRSGRFLINSIEQRQQTIERITREIIKVQEGIFEHGVARLKPLTMTQIADVVGCTRPRSAAPSRTNTSRPRTGCFDFQIFFTPGYQADSGDSVSNTSVKEMINDLIAGRTAPTPSATKELVARLQGKGINIARGRSQNIARNSASCPAIFVGNIPEPDSCSTVSRSAGSSPAHHPSARSGWMLSPEWSSRNTARGIAPGRKGDHSRVVSGMLRLRGEKGHAPPLRRLFQRRPQLPVMGNPSG